MYPPAADNYSADSCSIMCLQTVPPIVVIATCSGKIYHSVLLKEDFDDDDKKVKTLILIQNIFILNSTAIRNKQLTDIIILSMYRRDIQIFIFKK